MRVVLSLAESLMNAITHDRVHGVQFKRGKIDDRKTHSDLTAVIGRSLDSEREAARANGFREVSELRQQLRRTEDAMSMMRSQWEAKDARIALLEADLKRLRYHGESPNSSSWAEECHQQRERIAQLEAKVKELADANGFDALRAEKLEAALDDAETELRFVEETQAAILKTRITLLEAALEKAREFSRTVSSMLGRFPQSAQLQWKEFAEALAKVEP